MGLLVHAAAAVAAAALAAGCALGPHARPGDPAASPVALVLDGTAAARRDVREGVVGAVASSAERAVVVVDGTPDAGTDARVARLAPEVPGIARYDRSERRCAKERAVAAALAAHADAVYRVRLDYTAVERTATDDDRAHAAPAGFLAALGFGSRDVVLEETLAGEVERATFDGHAPEHRRIERTARHLAPNGFTERLDPATAVTAALADVPAVPAPAWDAVARRLVAAGCPLLGLAVGETFVHDDGALRKLHASAVAALRRSVGARKTVETPPADDAAQDDVAAAPAAKTPGTSCRELCDLHMVELCNHDRTLWSQHNAEWESTRCGVRRSEPFLESCYRIHWLDGTYEHACVEPCEDSPEGRERLLAILRRAGCVRGS